MPPTRKAPSRRGTSRNAGRRPRSTPAARRRRSFVWRFRRLFFLLTLLFVAGVAGAAWVLVAVELPAEAPPAQTTFIYDAHGTQLAALSGEEDRVTVALDEVPQVLIDAVLAAEDRKFFAHTGVDLAAIARATWVDIRERGVAQGGSTITQQYVKNVYVGAERSIWRKLKEAVIAVKLERELDKAEILERYLNTVYFGRGAYGVQAASRAYFDKDVGEIGLREAAFLAGLIRAPEAAEPERSPREADRRRDVVLAGMVATDRLSESGRDQARAEPVAAYVVPRRERNVVHGGEIGTQYFVEYVRRQLSARYGDQVVYSGGLRVHTTLDLDLQRAAYDAVYGTLDGHDDPEGALVAVDDRGHVLAMVGGRRWEESKVNLAVGGEGGGRGRQPGSAFKPFVLAEAVKQGYSVESALPAPGRIVLAGANAGADWTVSNYAGTEQGTLNLIDATRVSSNTVYAQLVQEVGPENVVALARRMGIRSELAPVPSITLGTQNVSVLDMAAAYLTFATRGMRIEPTVITRVTTAGGDLLYEARPERTRVLEEAEADVVNFVLRQAVERGTGTAARLGVQVAGKTGTTQGHGDAWFVGYTPRISVAVWMGYPEGQERAMTNVRGVRVTGGSFPAQIFRRFMVEALAKIESARFVEPRGFSGRVLNARIEYADPDATTTTTTEAQDEGGDTPPTTDASPATTTTAPAPTTTTTPDEPTTTTTPDEPVEPGPAPPAPPGPPES